MSKWKTLNDRFETSTINSKVWGGECSPGRADQEIPRTGHANQGSARRSWSWEAVARKSWASKARHAGGSIYLNFETLTNRTGFSCRRSKHCAPKWRNAMTSLMSTWKCGPNEKRSWTSSKYVEWLLYIVFSHVEFTKNDETFEYVLWGFYSHGWS